MALYSVRSERQFCEQLEYNLLYRWFLDMNVVGGQAPRPNSYCVATSVNIIAF